MRKPLVSIVFRTYNDQNFLTFALEGIFNQKVDFNLEFIYSDDCSNDNSFEMVKREIDESSKFSHIHMFKQPVNLGVTGNLLYTLNNANGDYIALCDGDDYWCDPYKLQNQVDFLEANPDFEVCFTNVCTVDENGLLKKERLMKEGRRTEYEMRHLPTISPVSSRVFRNDDFSYLHKTIPGEDMYMLLYQSKKGKLKLINKVMSAYRYQGAGVYSSLKIEERIDFLLKTHMGCMELLTEDLYPKYQRLILKKIVELRYNSKVLYKQRRVDFKLFMRKYPNRFSVWQSIKIKLTLMALRLLDFTGLKVERRLILRIIDRVI